MEKLSQSSHYFENWYVFTFSSASRTSIYYKCAERNCHARLIFDVNTRKLREKKNHLPEIKHRPASSFHAITYDTLLENGFQFNKKSLKLLQTMPAQKYLLLRVYHSTHKPLLKLCSWLHRRFQTTCTSGKFSEIGQARSVRYYAEIVSNEENLHRILQATNQKLGFDPQLEVIKEL